MKTDLTWQLIAVSMNFIDWRPREPIMVASLEVGRLKIKPDRLTFPCFIKGISPGEALTELRAFFSRQKSGLLDNDYGLRVESTHYSTRISDSEIIHLTPSGCTLGPPLA